VSYRHRGRSTPTDDSAPSGDHVEAALDALRREWRSGFNGRMVGMLALPAIRRLKDLAPTTSGALELRQIEDRLIRYEDLSIEQRKDELVDLANRIKAIQPDIALATAPGPEMGTLREALLQAKPPPKPRAARSIR
jgi:hypothetical protein